MPGKPIALMGTNPVIDPTVPFMRGSQAKSLEVRRELAQNIDRRAESKFGWETQDRNAVMDWRGDQSKENYNKLPLDARSKIQTLQNSQLAGRKSQMEYDELGRQLGEQKRTRLLDEAGQQLPVLFRGTEEGSRDRYDKWGDLIDGWEESGTMNAEMANQYRDMMPTNSNLAKTLKSVQGMVQHRRYREVPLSKMPDRAKVLEYMKFHNIAPDSPQGKFLLSPMSGGGNTIHFGGGVDADGNPVIAPSKATQTKLEKKLLDSQESFYRLQDMQSNFDPEFLKIPWRGGELMKDITSKMGGKIDKGMEQKLEKFYKFRASSIRHMSLMLNQLSGAAVSPQEYERIKGFLPNVGTGLFDGDNPIEFKAKMDSAMKLAKLSIARSAYIRRKGMSEYYKKPWMAGISLEDGKDSMESIIQKRGNALLKIEMKKSPNLSEAFLRNLVKQKVAREFGFGGAR